jgi:hypothetical protein
MKGTIEEVAFPFDYPLEYEETDDDGIVLVDGQRVRLDRVKTPRVLVKTPAYGGATWAVWPFEAAPVVGQQVEAIHAGRNAYRVVAPQPIGDAAVQELLLQERRLQKQQG